jgi:hypothetical protein
LADAEKIWKKLPVQEEFLPIQNVNVSPEALRKICDAAMEWGRRVGDETEWLGGSEGS